MPPIVFFSYARTNLDPYLEEFFKDLCSEIAPLTDWSPEDENISFRDTNNLRVMENWKSHIQGALQSSTVLVCITSVAYFHSEFCGKEYYVFDQRRRQGLKSNQDPPAVILPVIWAPVAKGLPAEMSEPQQIPAGISDRYRQQGLRALKRFDRDTYDRCVSAFASAICQAWEKHAKMKPLANLMDFQDIPNSFANGDWQEAAGPGGWLSGPEVANFIFVAGSHEEMAAQVEAPKGRYGSSASEWRPYLPPDEKTILDHARMAAAKQSLKFRELPAGVNLKTDIKGAKQRKNLTVLLADPISLAAQPFEAAAVLEQHWWEGAALVLPCDDKIAPWDEAGVQSLQTTFPVISQLQTPNLQAPVRSALELQHTLDLTLTYLRTSVIQSETDKKEKTGDPPPAVSAAPLEGK
jgi:hypothetical protein